MPKKYGKQAPDKYGKVMFSLRLTPRQREALQAIADSVGYGVTISRVILTAIDEKIAREKA